MENTIELVKSDFSKFMRKELLDPLVEQYFDVHGTELAYFHRLEEPFALFLEEYYPEYYSEDYKAQIGAFYYASLYGDPISPKMLFEELKKYADVDDDVEGVKILFADSLDSAKYTLERDSVRELRLYYDSISDLIDLIIIKMLNSGVLEIFEENE